MELVSSTNWIVAEGGSSLQDSISFETSTTDAAAVAGSGALLLSPPTLEEDPAAHPCEITLSFKEKHEIHSVYIRSSARIYEIYYSYDHPTDNMEYLCTVRCGATAIEEIPTSAAEGVAPTESSKGNNGIQGDNNSSGDDDGWVDVKVPVSHVPEDQVNALSESIVESRKQICYEATAEISDSTPCLSVTLRLLSLQTKTCVRVEEIYIYADPVESDGVSVNGDAGENFGGASLLAMLVPNLKSLDRRIHATTPHEKSRLVQEPSEARVEEENTNSRPIEKEAASHQAPEASIADHVGKVLDELLSRVGRIEDFCSRFEESMMKPLGNIETRLQRLEQQLDAFAVRSQSSEQISSSGISAPEFLCEESNSETNEVAELSVPVAGVSDSWVAIPGDASDSVALDCCDDIESSDIDEALAVVPESHMRSGLSVKAPEFLYEEDEFANSTDTLNFIDGGRSSDKRTIDSVLASELSAFLTLTTAKSTNGAPSFSISDLAFPTVRTPCDADAEYMTCPGICFGKPSSVTDDDPSNRSSGSEHKDSNESDVGKKAMVMAPEFLVEDGDFVGSDDVLDLYCGGRESTGGADGEFAASALSVFLSSLTAKTCSEIQQDSTFTELSTASIGVPREGAERNENLLDLGLDFKFSPPNGKIVRKGWSSLGVSTSKCVDWHEWGRAMEKAAVEDCGLCKQDLPHCCTGKVQLISSSIGILDPSFDGDLIDSRVVEIGSITQVPVTVGREKSKLQVERALQSTWGCQNNDLAVLDIDSLDQFWTSWRSAKEEGEEGRKCTPDQLLLGLEGFLIGEASAEDVGVKSQLEFSNDLI